ncbi:MAG: spore germination protein [Clostridia bacterium]|nr:spore germination protein [Clostridia bacterium]
MELINEIMRPFSTPENYIRRMLTAGGRNAELVYNPDITDAEMLTLLVGKLELLSLDKRGENKESAQFFVQNLITVAEVKLESSIDTCRNNLLSGDAILEVEGVNELIVCVVRKWDKRAVAEPPTSTVMRGPREGFIEDFKTNLSLIERRVKSPDLAIEKLSVGKYSQSSVAIVYISSIADESVVKQVKNRLKSIDTDAIIDSHYLQPYLEDNPFSIFHQTGVTEKPDVLVAKLTEGRVGIIVDGSPMALTVPFMAIEDFQSGEDYYERSSLATFLRIIRLISVFFSVLLPGLYVALQQHHYSVIPLRFLLTVMTAVNGIPLSPVSEIVFVILLFEIIREASVRMPRAVGMAMSIVGALVLGDTAVKAGIISSPAVMITALSSIALYTVPNQEGTLTLLRLVFTFLGGFGGLYLLVVGICFLTAYLTTLGGYGVGYTAPFAPIVTADLKDGVYRASLLRMTDRPRSIKNKNPKRRGE